MYSLPATSRGLALAPGDADAHSNLGNALHAQGKLSEAQACHRRAIELSPDRAEAHSNLANALKDQGRLDEAIAAYRRALQLKPDLVEAHSNLLQTLHYRPGVTPAELRAAVENAKAADLADNYGTVIAGILGQLAHGFFERAAKSRRCSAFSVRPVIIMT